MADLMTNTMHNKSSKMLLLPSKKLHSGMEGMKLYTVQEERKPVPRARDNLETIIEELRPSQKKLSLNLTLKDEQGFVS